MKHKKIRAVPKNHPFTSLRLRNLRILSHLLKTFVSSRKYSQATLILSSLIPLIKKKDTSSVFAFILAHQSEALVSDSIFEYISKLFSPEQAILYQITPEINNFPKAALSIFEAVFFT
jgi:hypothetical protein